MFPLAAAAAVRLGRSQVASVNEFLFRLGRVVSTFQETPFKDVIQRKDLLSQPLSEYGLATDDQGVQLLKALKTSKEVPILSSQQEYNRDRWVNTVTVNEPLLPGLPGELLPETIIIRSFYNRLAQQLLNYHWSVLLGNPGVSKSWFQWYLLYVIASKKVGPGLHVDIRDQPPTVVVRQNASSYMTYYFPQTEEPQVYETFQVTPALLHYLDPSTTLYLFEPASALIHPYYNVFNGKIIATCSPDERRYKEFVKNKATMFYMPGWTLDELQLVGEHMLTENQNQEVDCSPKAIETRYRRFGGIIRHVFPSNMTDLLQSENKQESELNDLKLADVFAPYRSIEKRDSNKQNVSHYLLQYCVEYDKPCKYKKDKPLQDKLEFTQFSMQIASDYVEERVNKMGLNDQELLESIQTLKLMFQGGTPKVSKLFETVVYHTIANQQLGFSWQIFDSGEWKNHKWDITKAKMIDKDCENVINMEPGILYRPVDPKFPGADFVFVKEKKSNERRKRAFGIQVTFQKDHHKKSESVYQKLYQRLGMDPYNDEITVYLITHPTNVDGYIQNTFKKLTTGFSEADMPKLCFQVVNCSWVFKRRTM